MIALLLLAASAAAALSIPEPPTRRLNDYAGALDAGARARLEQKLAGAESRSSNQVVVAIFRGLRGENLEDYSIRLAQAWRIGQKGLDNGVIFLVFLDDRKMRLEVGYGLEATLTDATAASIIRDVVAPRFREGRLADGIDAGIDAIHAAIAGTYAARPPRRGGGAEPLVLAGFALMLLVGIPLVVISALQARRQRGHGWTGGRRGWGVVSPGVGRGSWGGSWGGGGVSSSSDRGSSSGGFDGGGGSFGGGGASGSW